jgi:hypothetical protein
MLLSYLLKETKKKRLYFTDSYKKYKRILGIEDTADLCFSEMLNDELHNKINNERFLLPKHTKFENGTWDTYVERLKYFGYDVQTVKIDIKYPDGNGEEQTTHRKEYYIPPFICKRDANLIIQSIENSHISEDRKRELVHKFISESGCHRYSKDDLEESELPTPSKKEWKDNDYALIIYTVLRSYANPLPVISNTKDSAKKKENLQDLIIKHYGSPNQRAAITNNLNSMIAVGLPIKKEGTKYVFDMSGTLTAEDLNLIQGCIMQNDALDGNTKARLIDKFREIFYSSLV